jgi:hypothetical protein
VVLFTRLPKEFFCGIVFFMARIPKKRLCLVVLTALLAMTAVFAEGFATGHRDHDS